MMKPSGLTGYGKPAADFLRRKSRWLIAPFPEHVARRKEVSSEITRQQKLAGVVLGTDSRPLSSHKAEVARATGIPRSTITNVLSGRRQISKENVIRLAAYFHVDPGVFLPEG